MNTEQKRQKFLEIVEKNGSAFMGVKFLKKDGSGRPASFNPRQRLEVKGTRKRTENPDIYTFVESKNKETGKPEWRSFDFKRLVKAKSRGQVFFFQ